MTSPYNFQAAADPKMQSIVVKKHGQYLLSPSKPGGNLPALVGFHGYADTAEQHLEMLKAIPTNDPWLCCAVQSLNLFYTKSMKIVGNWMTSFDRENAIIDNVNYVDAVVSELQNAFKASKQLVYVGFSQGAPMAYRAALLGRHSPAGLVILAGDFPPELASADLSKLPPILLCRGSQDKIVPREQIEKDKAIFDSANVPCEVFEFEASHCWNEIFCQKVAGFLTNLPK